MDFNNDVPILLLHFLEWNIPENTSIIYQNIDSTEIIYGSFYYFISKLNGIIISNCNSTFRFNFLDYFVCSLARSSLSRNLGSEIINNNFCTSAGKE
jgi:hypothetical protein